MPRNNMPEGWEPPAPAWQSLWKKTDDDLVAGYFGIQADSADLLQAWADTAFSLVFAPELVEQGQYVDQAGVSNHLYIAYWRQSQYQQWWAQQSNNGWWADEARETDGVGYWREIVLMPFDHFETLYSSEDTHGIGKLSEDLDGPMLEHGYAGGARDRIELSDHNSLKNAPLVSQSLQSKTVAGRNRTTVVPPKHMCVIRSGQDWGHCTGDEKAYYLENVHPVLIKGMTFLRDNPEQSNCYSMRFVQQRSNTWGEQPQTFGLGYATDIHAFEDWAKSHPTHLAIFGNFMKMVETFQADVKLQLWHEVAVLPSHGCEFEYIGCHPETGLLSYAQS